MLHDVYSFVHDRIRPYICFAAGLVHDARIDAENHVSGR